MPIEIPDTEAIYELHIPQQEYWGEEDPVTLRKAFQLATQKGVKLQMLPQPVMNGLSKYEEEHPDAAVIFDVEGEDLIAVEVQ